MKKLSLPVPLVITPEHPFSPDTSGLLLVGNFGMTPTNSKGLVLVREAVKAANVNVGQVELVNINKKLEVEEITKLISEKLLTFHPSKIILFGNTAVAIPPLMYVRAMVDWENGPLMYILCPTLFMLYATGLGLGGYLTI
jgi:hypothetical protein